MMNKITAILFLLFMTLGLSAQSPVDAKATAETKALLRNLKAQQGKKILFGHQDDSAYGIAWWDEQNQSDVKKVTGRYPAVMGWDLGMIEVGDTLNLDKIPFSTMRKLMLEAYKRGDINTVSWHLRNPYFDGSSWDVKNDSVKNTVASILPKGGKHEVFKKWLDRVALFVSSLKDENGTQVPVLFRPYHEHSGSWFWWGKDHCSRKQYVDLWHFTVEYLRDVKGVHNLLYVYSPDYVNGKDEYFDRYPGDKYIDVLGLDLYHREAEKKAAEYMNNVSTTMQFLDEYSKKNDKLFVFSETGSEGLPMKNWFTEVLYKSIQNHKPAYVLVWRNAYDIPGHFYAPYPGHPACPDFVKFKDMPDVIFSGENDVNLYK